MHKTDIKNITCYLVKKFKVRSCAIKPNTIYDNNMIQLKNIISTHKNIWLINE